MLEGRKQLIKAANEHMGELVDVASNIPPGKYDVAAIFAAADSLHISPEVMQRNIGLNADAETIKMLRNVQSIEKSADGHVVVTQNSEQKLPLDVKTAGGEIDDVKFDKTISFDLQPNSRHISNLKGISVEAHGGVPARPLVANVQDVTVTRDASGKTVVKAEVSNPENFFERVVTGDYGDKIPVDIQLQDDGKVVVTKHGQQVGKI